MKYGSAYIPFLWSIFFILTFMG